MNIKQIKKMLLWPQIRRQIIYARHKRVSEFCKDLKTAYDKNAVNYLPRPKQDLGAKRIIWQYWAQGVRQSELPELIQLCFNSVDRLCNSDDYLVIRLSDYNISEYIDLPDFVIRNKDNYPIAMFADLLRCCLLCAYGGCWLDSTVFLTAPIPDRYWASNLFLFQRSKSEINRNYWENAFAYYYGWSSKFKVRILNSIIFARRNNEFLSYFTNVLLHFWKNRLTLPDYFFFQILWNIMSEGEADIITCEENDCCPHYLQQYLNDEMFYIKEPEEIFAATSIHKLTYKSDNITFRLKKIIESCGMPI